MYLSHASCTIRTSPQFSSCISFIMASACPVQPPCSLCGKELTPGAKTRCIENGTVAHEGCIKCVRCKCVNSEDAANEMMFIENAFYHAQCTSCPGCKARIHADHVKLAPSAFTSRSIFGQNGELAVWHTNCWGCECKACDLRLSYGLRDERSSTIKDMFWNGRGFSQPGFIRHNRVVNGAVMDIRHISCSVCKNKIGDWGNVSFWSPGDLPIVHPKCMACGDCVIHTGVGNSWTRKRDGTIWHNRCLNCHVCNEKQQLSYFMDDGGRNFIEDLDGQLVHNDCMKCDLCMTAKKGYFVDKCNVCELSVCEQLANEDAGYPLSSSSYIHHACPKGVKRKFDDALAAQPSKPRKRAQK